MPQAAIFDIDGTLIDSVDLHAVAWQEALAEFGHHVSFAQVRSQIGKGGDKLIPEFLSEQQQRDHGEALETWRGQRFEVSYLPLVRPFSAVPELMRHARASGLRIAVASSAKKEEVETYLGIARISHLVDIAVSAEDVDQSKPAPDVFNATLTKLRLRGHEAIAIGDTPYDAEGARKAGIAAVGVLCGGFDAQALREAGCAEIYPGPAGLLACFDGSPLARQG